MHPIGCALVCAEFNAGHPIIELPPSVWLDQARRSGDHFNWFILASVTLLLYLWSRGWHYGQYGFNLILGIVSANTWKYLKQPFAIPCTFRPAHESHTRHVEWLFIIAGFGLILLGQSSKCIDTNPMLQSTLGKVGWALLLALPYFLTYFYSYSYHYRLSFAIIPLC